MRLEIPIFAKMGDPYCAMYIPELEQLLLKVRYVTLQVTFPKNALRYVTLLFPKKGTYVTLQVTFKVTYVTLSYF